ncbi:uncharacterized lipoprotein YddW (UPF0748 family)/fibronectin type 3 domain-containing protein [Paenibacillus sp. V4I3]|uniref:family 10 glycosylhydrolase n=1 Tax=Paenibacillus sp. V4I3 TaxID=3042305 RepID=UPI002782409A|nr:family 10 glycosylhydrolase [Paenibacillus sp. V4I3]MDQ0875780.1 uncharacterized lipoprotein YddW (UPF0748 family)/fibronectin type 3 domain-containing protein [Paenibacillus sp. V4I3]
MKKSVQSRTALIPFTMVLLLFLSTIIFGVPVASADTEAALSTDVQALAGIQAAAGVEGFEQTANLFSSSARATASIGLIGRPETIYYGYHVIKLSYDFTGTTGTSAAYVNFKDPDGTTGRTLQGLPKRLGLWVYGDGNNHWLRAQVKDSAGTVSALDFTSSNGLNWTGWKYITVSVPSSLRAPIKLNQIYVAETKDNNKNKGALYFDQLTAFYTDSTVYGLDLVDLPLLQVGESKKAQVFATYQNAAEPVPVTSGLSFRSSNEQVVTVDANGTVRALQSGTATIYASYGTAPEASYVLTVSTSAAVPSRIEQSSLEKLESGSTNKIRLYAVYTDMTEPVTVLSGATFESSAPDIATVDADGLVKAVKPGTTTITMSYKGVSTAYTLNVNAPVPILQSIKLTELHTMTVGDTLQAKVLGTYTWLTEQVELTSGVTYTSSNPAVAAVGVSGVVTALKFGTSRITATYGGKTSDFYLTVNKVATIPKSELRAAWIATVDNIDWPNKSVTDQEQQKRDFTKLLEQLQTTGINAVIVQVKPTADSFYPSQFGPWSEWLTGVQGKDPGYNPLAFMMEEVHKRNMEFHAWFNPYRISLQDRLDKLVPDHPARQHPDWVVSYGGKLYFNPGIPEAKQFIMDGIMEVVKNYDIDAVHFDDYFYPYPVSGVDFPDQDAFQKYGTGFASKADWRRNNVNSFVQEIGTRIKQEKSYVKFGISPFGIWKNKGEDPAGSDTNGLSSYDAIYADSKKWVDQQWIDYIAPQIYWYMGYSPAAYDKLIEWWNGAVAGKNVHLYSGQATYRIGSNDPGWLNPNEMRDQVSYNRNFGNVKGSIFFSAKWLPANPLGFTDRLKTDLYRYPTLVPAMPWLDDQAPNAPVLASAFRKPSGVELTWANGLSDAAYYVVYRFEGNTAGSLQDASKIVATVRKQEGAKGSFIDRTAVDGSRYTYLITAVDRLHNESAASNAIAITNVLDVTAPVTTATVEGTMHNGWYVSEATVKLTATDDLTGVSSTQYSTDNGVSWQPYGGLVTVEADGVTPLLYRSEDAAGNVEIAKSMEIRIDRSAPVIQMGGGTTFSVDQTVQIKCTASDTVSGLVYNPCTANLVHAPAYELGLGSHVVTIDVQDAAGNAASASFTYTVQTTISSVANVTRTFVTGPGAVGVTNSLVKKLEHGNYDAFINEVQAQTGKRLTMQQADVLIRLAASLQ